MRVEVGLEESRLGRPPGMPPVASTPGYVMQDGDVITVKHT